MRFYKVITLHNQDYINTIIKTMSTVEVDYITKIYNQISMVEYTDEKRFECMFAILDKSHLSILDNLYKRYNINFEFIDLTKEVICGENFKTNYSDFNDRNVEKEILSLIKDFKSNWVSKDDILDKILEKGINSLTDFDLEILSS